MSTTGPMRRAGAGLRRRHRLLRERPDAGYSVLEAAITVPVMFLLVMFIAQWAIVWHSNHVVQAAAQEGLRTAEAYRSTAAAGKADAEAFLHQVAPHAISGVVVTVGRTATTVTVHIHATVMSATPLGHYTVDATAAGPVEAYVNAP